MGLDFIEAKPIAYVKQAEKKGRPNMREEPIGKVSRFFARPLVAAMTLNASLRVGDRLHIKGNTTDLRLTVESMQIEHQQVQQAEAGQQVGIKVPDRVREGDTVYRIIEE
jgi:translation initiation factor IF-2